MLRNVQRAEAGEELLGLGPCCGVCDAGGLLGLDAARRMRLTRACHGGHFTATELQFVRWQGLLPASAYHMLIGRVGPVRDAMLQRLMQGG